MISTWITTLLTFLIGYVLGVHSQSPEKTKQVMKKIRRKIKPTKLGGIEKLSAADLEKRGTKLEEEEKEMEKVLGDVL